MVTMNKISTRLITSLRTLGLTEYEAKVYSALVLFEYAEAKEIVEYLDISKPSVYESLRSLEDRGLVTVTNKKPAVYNAIPPEIAVKLLLDAHKKASEEASEELLALERDKVKAKSSSAFWSIYGRDSIEYKIEDMIRHASSNIFCIMSDRYQHYLEPVSDKGLNINVLMLSDNPETGSRLNSMFRGGHVKIRAITASRLMSMVVALKSPGNLTGKGGVHDGTYPEAIQEFISGFDFNNMFILIVDDSEFLYIPPLSGEVITALNTTNKAMITMSKAISGIWLTSIESLATQPANEHA